jgi:hypothetical protein
MYTILQKELRLPIYIRYVDSFLIYLLENMLNIYYLPRGMLGNKAVGRIIPVSVKLHFGQLI